jgi:hypothetical protein
MLQRPPNDHEDDAVQAAGPYDAPSPELARLLAMVRTEVTRYVVARRGVGAPIERVLPEVKCLVRASQVYERWDDPRDTLMTQVVHWVIGAYYDEPALAHVPRFY